MLLHHQLKNIMAKLYIFLPFVETRHLEMILTAICVNIELLLIIFINENLGKEMYTFCVDGSASIGH